jgi:deoxyribonuclease V
MRVKALHDWDVDYAEARRLQAELAARLVLRPLPKDVHLVAGADLAFSGSAGSPPRAASMGRGPGRFFAAVVVLTFPQMEPVEVVTADAEPTVPYIPGLLSFREGPVVIEAVRKLTRRPDVFLFDGQGCAHPRRCGLASHMGLWLGLPAVGCAKSRLIGEHAEPGRSRGESVPLMDGDEQIGVVLRTRANVKPLYVSPGHLADFATSAQFVLRCCTRYRLPEPTRLAHIEVGSVKKAYIAGIRERGRGEHEHE